MMEIFYLILKTLHVYAFIAAIGVTLASLIAYRKFWLVYDKDPAHGLSAFPIIQGLQVAGGIGMGVLLLAGIGMLAIAHWSFIDLTWFQVKLGMIALIFINGATTGRTSAMQVKGLMENAQPPYAKSEVPAIKSRVRLFFSIQLALFAAIILLSVFR